MNELAIKDLVEKIVELEKEIIKLKQKNSMLENDNLKPLEEVEFKELTKEEAKEHSEAILSSFE